VERMKSGENLAMFTTMVAFIKKAMWVLFLINEDYTNKIFKIQNNSNFNRTIIWICNELICLIFVFYFLSSL
jgi:amino acid permease